MNTGSEADHGSSSQSPSQLPERDPQLDYQGEEDQGHLQHSKYV